MKKICSTIFSFLLASALTFCIVIPASAQYIWLDKNNVKVYSDKPPPTDIPASRIIKKPRPYQPPAVEETKNEEGEDTNGSHDAQATNAAQRPVTTAEKNAEFKKRRMERQEREKKEALEEKNRQAKAENCRRARAYQRALQSGQRIARTAQSGERAYMGDEERAEETRKVEETLRECN